DYIPRMRAELPRAFPDSTIYFQTADIVSQVLNFGLSAPIDIQIQGADIQGSYALGQKILTQIAKVPGVADPHILQVMSYPALQIACDPQRAAEVGVNPLWVADNFLTSLSSSVGVSPSFFLSPLN